MKIFALLGIVLLAFAMLAPNLSEPETARDRSAAAIAMNYALFREAVFYRVFVEGYKNDRTISLSELDMPNAWIFLRQWRARVEDGKCVVWGEAAEKEIREVRRLFHGSLAVGRNENGRIWPWAQNPVPVPAFVPEGSLVTVVNARPNGTKRVHTS